MVGGGEGKKEDPNAIRRSGVCQKLANKTRKGAVAAWQTKRRAGKRGGTEKGRDLAARDLADGEEKGLTKHLLRL